MPIMSVHEKVYAHNKKMLNDINELKNPQDALDWGITIIFYSALHLIEKELSKSRKHCYSHEERKNTIHQEFKTIFRDYKLLYDYSKRARYEGHDFTQHDLQTVLASLNAIESYFHKSAKTS